MMRSRGHGHAIRASTYQYHPDFLLFSTDMRRHSPKGLYAMITKELPPELRQGWKYIMRGFKNYDSEEAEAEETASWIQANGRALGFRVPTAAE
eukprot:15269478-Heterocapsa_arctica.AAC.1